MELKFNETAVGCMECLVSQRQQQEQTLEVRLPDGMPDIGRILGVWGQPMIRGKEWRTGSAAVSGGTMVWVLYAPEDGSVPRCVDGWMPFQMQWDIPDQADDGFIHVRPRMRSMDARSVSARKIMVRAALSMEMDALVQCQKKLYMPETPPEDIQLLQRSYPMELMMESGEKSIQIDEDIIIPGNYPSVSKIVRYEAQPEITEQKVMAGRLVFRGICRVHMLYSSEDGILTGWDQEIPFSQYADLSGEYSSNAAAEFSVIPTGMELDKLEDGKLLFKCSMIAQYIIFDRVMVDTVEDAYSPCRKVDMTCGGLDLPVRLDERTERLAYTKNIQASGERVADQAVLWDTGSIHQNGDMAACEFLLQHQLLTYDENGTLHSMTARSTEQWTMPSDPANQIRIAGKAGNAQIAFDGESADLSGSLELDVSVFSKQGLNVVTGIEYGEKLQPDPGRPSLILRRAGEQRLWDLAKECCSTVAAIKEANQLQQEPQQDQMLLIPIY